MIPKFRSAALMRSSIVALAIAACTEMSARAQDTLAGP